MRPPGLNTAALAALLACAAASGNALAQAEVPASASALAAVEAAPQRPSAASEPQQARSPAQEALRTELEAMLEAHHHDRARLQAVVAEQGARSDKTRALAEQVNDQDLARQKRLVRMLDRQGWPDAEQLGLRASESAFVLLYEAALPLQSKYLPVLRQGVATGRARPDWLALMLDRVRVRQGWAQLYGSEVLRNADGTMEILPIRDLPQLDARRAEVGMEPMAEYARRLGLVWTGQKSMGWLPLGDSPRCKVHRPLAYRKAEAGRYEATAKFILRADGEVAAITVNGSDVEWVPDVVRRAMERIRCQPADADVNGQVTYVFNIYG